MNDSLIEGFAYDLWANLQWLDALPGFRQHGATAEDVLAHVLRAHVSWLARCRGVEQMPNEPDALREGLVQSAALWQEFLATSDPSAFVSYRSRQGDAVFSTVDQIACHVLNHGTYHRGHLRGLAHAEKFDDTPDTDLIAYYRRVQA